MTEVDANFVNRHRLDLLPTVNLHNQLVNVRLMRVLPQTQTMH